MSPAVDSKVRVSTSLIVSAIMAGSLMAPTGVWAASFQSFSPLPGDTDVVPNGVSADGSVVVGQSSPWGDQGFRPIEWTASGGALNLGSQFGSANAVSSDGSVIVGGATLAGSNSLQAFRWTAGSGLTGLGVQSGYGSSTATAVSSDGSVIVGYSSTGYILGSCNATFCFVTVPQDQAFRWTASGGLVGLGFFPGASAQSFGSSEAYGVSADGSVVVGASTYGGNIGQAFRWTSATGMVALGVLPGDWSSTATAVSADGSVVVGYSQNLAYGAQAFRWTCR